MKNMATLAQSAMLIASSNPRGLNSASYEGNRKGSPAIALILVVTVLAIRPLAAQQQHPCSDLRQPQNDCVKAWRCNAADHAWWPQTLEPSGTQCATLSGQKGTCPGGKAFTDMLPVCVASSGKSSTSASAPQVRMRWQDFVSGSDGVKRLASLTAAVAKMKSLDSSAPNTADFRRSWRYWANIHGYYGPKSPDGTVEAQIQYLQSHGMGNEVSYYQGIADQTPPDDIASQIWATCQHSDESSQALNFFAWHRMYLYYFERVLRWAAADDTLRLPYWDYTNTAQVALPADFQQVKSVFYDSRRDPGINTGSTTLKPNSTDIDTLLLQQSDYFAYEFAIEEGIHGYVHCTVGPTCPVAHMGDVPVAANDPIFYEHHANIDRLWACWQKLHATPGGDWQNQPFQFVDETGTLRTNPVSSVLDTKALGYIYDNDSSCTRTAEPEPAAGAAAGRSVSAKAAPQVAALGSVQNVHLAEVHTSVDIPLPRDKVRALFVHPAATELVLRDVTAQSPPGVLFDVYIATLDTPTARTFVGTISWFGVFGHHGGRTSLKRTLRFNVTELLRKLGGTARTSGITVSIDATTGRIPSNVPEVAGEAMSTDASKAFRPKANVQIGTIELRQSVSSP